MALGLAPLFRRAGVDARILAAGLACCVLPDVDSLGHWMGIPVSHPLGHRGLTHSIAFALAVTAGAAALFGRAAPSRAFPWGVFAFLFLCAVSHPMYDAMTNGGPGVAFLAPFDNRRFFFPWRPIVVSPISVTGFFNERAFAILKSELKWVVLPSAIAAGVGLLLTRRSG